MLKVVIKHASLTIILSSLLLAATVYAGEPTNQELLDMLKKQQAQIEQLQQLLNITEQKIQNNDEKIESGIAAIEENLSSTTENKTKIGGYGELHYNNIDDQKSVDFHRFVLYFGHEFSDSMRFFSEFELEYSVAGEGRPGVIQLEQAYIEMDLTPDTSLKTGAFLIPVGIINETHEPNRFYGVERNPIERNVLPATWWEAGAAFSTRFSEGLIGDFAIHSGLNVPLEGNQSFLIRSGRQKVAKAKADSLAYTARIKYTAIPGLELAASYQLQTDITQGAIGADANLLTAHAAYQSSSFSIRALYANWEIGGSAAKLIGRDSQMGFYIEPSYRINEKYGLFARFNSWDNNAGDDTDSEKKQTNIGLNYWPHENIVYKVDFENQSGAQKGNGFNLGVGYQF